MRAIALETGDADSSVWPLVTEDELRLSESGQFTTFVTSALAVNHFPLNNQHPALSDKRVRQAINYAIDKESMLKNLLKGYGKVMDGQFVPKNVFGYNPNLKP